MNLRPSDLAMFERLRVPPGLLERAGIRRVTDPEARELLTLRWAGNLAGIEIPSFDPETMNNGRRRLTSRVRLDNPVIRDGKEVKYATAFGDRNCFYYPPVPEFFEDVSIPVALVEAEKSALAITAWSQRTGKKILALGMGGCWSWKGRIGIVETANGARVPETGPIRHLEMSCRDGRLVYVLLDSNCATNPKVQAARTALVRQLRKQRADVRVIDLPPSNGVNGPDDFIGIHGDEAFADLLTRAKVPEETVTEFDLADDLAARCSIDMRYVPLWSKWLKFSTCWKEDPVLRVWDCARSLLTERSENLDKASQKTLRSARTVSDIERLCRPDPRLVAVPDQFDCDLWLFNTPRGTVNLKTGQLREHRSQDYITKVSGIAPAGDCPLWQTFLQTVTGEDDELRSFLQRVAGYCLTGETYEDALFFLYGLGANGKGTFVNTLLHVFGDYGHTAAIETFTEQKNDRHPTEMAAMRGKRLVTASETEAGKRWAESRIKMLTGGDPVTARFMHCDEFTYIPQFKLIIQGNHKPSLRSVNEAVRRRFNLIPFTITIPPEDRDKELSDKLRAEAAGILRWVIEGCLQWQREGLNPPQKVREATEEYLNSEDAMASWMDDRCILSPQAGSTKASVLYKDYAEWTEQAREFVFSQKRFGQELEDRGIKKRKSNGWRYEGISLRERDAES